MRRSAGPAALCASAVALLVGCSAPQSSDFKREAERTINEDNGTMLAVDVEQAECEPPESTSAQTTFPCVAVDASGNVVPFMAEMTGSNEFVVAPTAG